MLQITDPREKLYEGVLNFNTSGAAVGITTNVIDSSGPDCDSGVDSIFGWYFSNSIYVNLLVGNVESALTGNSNGDCVGDEEGEMATKR